MPLTDFLVPKIEMQTVTCTEPIVCPGLRYKSLPSNPGLNQITVVGVPIEITIFETEEAAVQFFHSLLARTLFDCFVAARAAVESIN
jgi:hypothetical protein